MTIEETEKAGFDDSRRIALSGVFDNLVNSNLALTTAVQRLVLAVYLVLAGNVLMSVIFMVSVFIRR